jgi:hypothetical protein
MKSTIILTQSTNNATTLIVLKNVANPVNLPTGQLTEFELVFNVQTAKQSGPTIPPNVLASRQSNQMISDCGISD